MTPVSPEKFRAVLRLLGIAPQRDNKGSAVLLTNQLRRRIHELARDYNVAAVQEGIASCPLCSEILPAAGPRVQSDFASEEDDTEGMRA